MRGTECYRWSEPLAARIHSLALDRGRAIATGVLYVDGDRGMLACGATATPDRRRGAHRALIAARLRAARRLGCRTVAVVTQEPLPRHPSGSYRILRAGFEPAYARQIYVWTGAAG